MPQDVTYVQQRARQGVPLSDADQARLRQLASKERRTPDEEYQLGSLKGQARSTEAGRRLLDDVGHEQLARRAQPRRQQGQQGQGRDRIGSQSEYERNLALIDRVLAEGD